MKYIGIICGGYGDNIWDKDFKVEADTMKEAIDKITKELPLDSDIVEIEQKD